MKYKTRKYKNVNFIVANVENCKTNLEVLYALSHCPNGDYAHWVCKNCGLYHHSSTPPPRVNIVSKCFYCEEM